MGTRRRVALIAPKFFGYETKIQAAIERRGDACLLLDERIGNSFTAKFLTRVRVIQRLRWVMDRYMRRLIGDLEAFQPDVILMVNSETIGVPQLRQLRTAFPKARLISYMWDSSTKKPVTEEIAEAVDAAYSFDPVDCEQIPGWRHVPLFHSHAEFRPASCGDKTIGYSFIGTARGRRVLVLAKLQRSLPPGTETYFYLHAASPVHQVYYGLLAIAFGYRGVLSRKKIDYDTYTAVMRASRAVVDIEQRNQRGLTIRTLEAAFSGSPLLTTNRQIARYDFFAHSPALIYDERAPAPPPETMPDRDNGAFFGKYSIDSWVEALLSEGRPSYYAEPWSSSTARR